MRERIAKLIDIKSIVTLSLTAVFCFLSVTGAITAAEFMVVFTTVMGFYFGMQTEKKKNDKEKEDKEVNN